MLQLLKLCIVIQVIFIYVQGRINSFLSIARSPEELSFEEGEILYVTDDVKYKDWYLATTNKNRTGGLIPKNYGKIWVHFYDVLFYVFLVEESTEKLVNALHDAAKRGNIEFLQQSLANKVEKFILKIMSTMYNIGIGSWSW